MQEKRSAEQPGAVQMRAAGLAPLAEKAGGEEAQRLAVGLAELQTSLDELQVAEEELRAQNDELVATRAALEAERQRYQDLFDFAPDGYVVTDIAGTIQEANRSAVAMLAIPLTFLRGKPLASFVANEERRAFRIHLDQLRRRERDETLPVAGAPHEWDFMLQPREGPPFNAAVTISPTRDIHGELIALRWLIRDATERERAREEIEGLNRGLEQRVASRTAELEAANLAKDVLLRREQRAKLEAEEALVALSERNASRHFFAQTASRLLFSDDPREFLASLYEKLSALLGLEIYFHYLTREDGQGLRLDSHSGVPDDVARQMETLEFGDSFCGFVAQEGNCRIVEDVQECPDPRVEVVRSLGITAYACYPLLSQDRLIGTLSFGTRKRATFDADELALMQTFADHVAVAIDRARMMGELRQRAGDLVEADRRKDEFLAMLGHELRNPLGAASNAVYLMRRRGAEDPVLRRALDILDRQLRHQARLVDDLLNVTRIARGKISLRRERLDVVRLVQETVEDRRAAVEEAGLALVLELPGEAVPVAADVTRLAQVLDNLLQNAIKFTDVGGRVTVRVTAEGGGGERGAAGAPGLVAVTVQDTGSGIAPEMLPHLFETFAQADRTLERSQGGLGLGLALVKGLVKLHGGEVRAFSEGAGQGAEFTFFLPRLQGDAEPTAETPAEPARGNVKRILVVEDNRDAADTLCELLVDAGHQVEVAYSGTAALELARRFRPEVVLCDLGLPGLDGFAVAAALRKERATAAARMIAVSGYGLDEDRARAREAGFDAHVTKPVDPSELQQLMEAPSES